ncbi:hypothetical protein GCM10017567_51270 [Amycolatopsis bullii]|uniref:Uncharacterized protein n=1 Tax=Amycolatopsis bullii TaxID=941987 RepID=A0ABQ3KHM0_9PSEU|nr:hypothetical protein GCM10017567_51270 [Amycolatopsis bullii]
MPTAFQKELAHRPADLADLVVIALEEATRSVLESDHTLGGRAREQAAACEDQACALPALRTPRQAVVAAVHTAADLTRMGGLARRDPHRPGRSAARPSGPGPRSPGSWP